MLYISPAANPSLTMISFFGNITFFPLVILTMVCPVHFGGLHCVGNIHFLGPEESITTWICVTQLSPAVSNLVNHDLGTNIPTRVNNDLGENISTLVNHYVWGKHVHSCKS